MTNPVILFKHRYDLTGKDGFVPIETKFKDKKIVVKLGKIEFIPPENEEDDARLKFDYDLLEASGPIDVVELEQFIGDFVVQQLEDQLKSNTLTYGGGVDEA